MASVLYALGGEYSSYTFTDISRGLFLAPEECFGGQAGGIYFKMFDMEKGPIGQRFVAGPYDVVVAVHVHVLYVSDDMEATLTNVRHLLKAEGYPLPYRLACRARLVAGVSWE